MVPEAINLFHAARAPLTSTICDPPPEHLPYLWPQIEPHLKRATAYTHGLYEPIDLLTEALQGKVKIWISWNEEEKTTEAAMVSRICQYPRGRTCSVPFIGGRNLRGWKDKFVSVIEAYARAQGCGAMEGGRRKGWVRAAGYEVSGVILFKELKPDGQKHA